MPATEASRKAIQQKLSMQKSLGGGQKEEDFFSRRKEKFLQKVVDLGFDLLTVQDFLEEKSIYEENMELILDNLNNPAYVNTLKQNYIAPFNPMKAGPVQYQYQDPIQPINSIKNNSFEQSKLLSARQISLQEQSFLEDKDLCKICFAQKINTVLLPCGHRNFCKQCCKMGIQLCPICRKPVSNVVETFD